MTAPSGSGRPDVLAVAVPVATVWTSPEAPRDLDRPAVADTPDLAAWTAAMDAALRKGLSGRTLTQVLMGEQVQVLEEHGDWVRVAALEQPSSADPLGYPGWVRRAHLDAPVPHSAGPAAVVTARAATCAVDDAGAVALSFGTRLPVTSTDDRSATVALPGGRRGLLAREHLRIDHEGRQPGYAPDGVLDTAAQFLGLRYLWGGTSTWGLDCSGLVHLVFRSFGTGIPRDAFDQADRVEPVALDEVRAGDLYFFARPGERVYHVGFVSRPVGEDGVRWMLHAPEGGELIEDAPLAPHRLDTLVSAGRVQQPDADGPPRHEDG